MKRVIVCVINNWPYLHTQFVSSVVNMMVYSKEVMARTNIDVMFDFVWGAYIDSMRTQCAAKCIAGKFDYLIMLDADMVYPKDTVQRLVQHDKPVVGGLYYWKILKPFTDATGFGYAPHAYKKRKYEPLSGKKEHRYDAINVNIIDDDFIEVDGLGGGGMCIKREVLEQVGNPQFECMWYSEDMTSEDLEFCRRSKKAGFKVYLDLTLKFGHIMQSLIYKGSLYDQHMFQKEFHKDHANWEEYEKVNIPLRHEGNKLPLKEILKEHIKNKEGILSYKDGVVTVEQKKEDQ